MNECMYDALKDPNGTVKSKFVHVCMHAPMYVLHMYICVYGFCMSFFTPHSSESESLGLQS